MQKYLAIINRQTLYILVLCLGIAYFCRQFQFWFSLNTTLFSIAVVFPLVFTIRESFKRRDNLIKLLSVFKTSMNAVYHCFVDNAKLEPEKKQFVNDSLVGISSLFLEALQSQKKYDEQAVSAKMNELFDFVHSNSDKIPNSVAMKVIRFLKDVHESMENTVGLKMHGTPVSLRAYCLVFIYVFPFVFIPTLAHDLQENSAWILYALSAIHGFILISLYNVQDDMEDPFDQVGLDDIKLESFGFFNAPAVSKPEMEPF